MDREILEGVDRQMGFLEEDDLAQVRLNVGDFSAAKFRSWIDARLTRASQISQGNAQFFGILTQQLGVPQADALATAEALLDAQLKCPLRGEYELAGNEGAGLDFHPASPVDARGKMPEGLCGTKLGVVSRSAGQTAPHARANRLARHVDMHARNGNHC